MMKKKNGHNSHIVNLNVTLTEEMIEESLVALSRTSKISDRAINFLVPKGYRPIVELCDENGRGKHRNSSISSWKPEIDEIRVYFEPVGSRSDYVKIENMDQCVEDICQALMKVESDPHEFISLKWFRDTFLMSTEYYWVVSQRVRQIILLEAIERGRIAVYKVPNPNNMEYPTTAIKTSILDNISWEDAVRTEMIKDTEVEG